MKQQSLRRAKKETYTPGDEWYNEDGLFHSQGENSFQGMVMSPLPVCPAKISKAPGISKIVNLIDFDECDVPVDISPHEQCLRPSTLEKSPEMYTDTLDMQKEPVTISLEEASIVNDLGRCGPLSLEQPSLNAPTCYGTGVEELLPSRQDTLDAVNLMDCCHADMPFGHQVLKKPELAQSHQEPKLPGPYCTLEDAKFSSSRKKEDLQKENQILLQRLADADEEKNIELSFIRDEVEDKQRMIDELIIKSREAEAQLSKLKSLSFQAKEIAEQSKALENLRAQLDERKTLLDYRESEVQRFDDAWRGFSGTHTGSHRSSGLSEERHCFSCKAPRIRGRMSMFRSIFSKRTRELGTYQADSHNGSPLSGRSLVSQRPHSPASPR